MRFSENRCFRAETRIRVFETRIRVFSGPMVLKMGLFQNHRICIGISSKPQLGCFLRPFRVCIGRPKTLLVMIEAPFPNGFIFKNHRGRERGSDFFQALIGFLKTSENLIFSLNWTLILFVFRPHLSFHFLLGFPATGGSPLRKTSYSKKASFHRRHPLIRGPPCAAHHYAQRLFEVDLRGAFWKLNGPRCNYWGPKWTWRISKSF